MRNDVEWRLTLGALLRAALDDAPANVHDVTAWTGRHRPLIEGALQRAPTDFDVEFVYHFLSDADIRVKDLKFRDFQVGQMRDLIGELIQHD